MSGILFLQRHAGKWKLNETLGDLPTHAAFWSEHSVHDLVDRFAEADVKLLFDTGDEDPTGCVEDNRRVHERLINRGIEHDYLEFPGEKHTWKYWGMRLGPHLEFHERNFTSRASGYPPLTGRVIRDRWHDLYCSRTLSFERASAAKWKQPDAPQSVVLLGSSSMQLAGRWNIFADLPVANRGISSDRIGLGERGLLHRLHCSVFDCNPRVVVIKVGRNDLAGVARGGPPTLDQVADAYREMLRRIRKGVPDADIVILASFPTSKSYEYIAEWVPRWNERLKAMAEAGEGKIHFVDTFTPLADEQGRLRSELTGDGLHLNREGYKVIRPLVIEALEPFGIRPEPAGM